MSVNVRKQHNWYGMKIKVEQRHINEGKKDSPFLCPIAIAVCEKLNYYIHDMHICVKYSNMSVYVPELHSIFYKLPQEASNFILNFDSGKMVRPFEFEAIHSSTQLLKETFK